MDYLIVLTVFVIVYTGYIVIGNKEQSEPWLKLADLPLLCVKNTRNTLSIPAFLCLD